LKKAIKLVERVSQQIENLNNLFTRRGLETFTNLSKEEKKTIDESLEYYNSLFDVDLILGDLETSIKEEVCEDSKDNRGDDKVL